MHNSLIVITCSFTTVHNTVHRYREQKVLMLRTFMPSLRISFSMRSARRFLTAVLTDNIWQRVVTTVWLIVYSWGCLNANGVSTYSCVSAVACLASVDVTSVLLDDSSVESTTMTELGESVLTLQLSRASAIPHVYVSERTKAKLIAAFSLGLVLQYSCSNEKKTDTGAQLLQTGIRVFLKGTSNIGITNLSFHTNRCRLIVQHLTAGVTLKESPLGHHRWNTVRQHAQ